MSVVLRVQNRTIGPPWTSTIQDPKLYGNSISGLSVRPTSLESPSTIEPRS